MRSMDWKCGLLAMSLAVGGVAAFGCGGESANSAPTAVPAASASAPPAAPVASASAAPAPAPAPAASESAPAQPSPAESSTEENDEAAAELVEHHRHHHHGGVGQFVAMSLDTLGVTPEQHDSIEKIQTALRAKLQPTRAADKKLIVALADGIAAGKIDKGKVDGLLAQIDSASGAVHAATVEALDKLHATLTDAQRSALVDKVQAHWQVWQKANEAGSSGGEAHEHGRLETLAADLSLAPEQVEKIRAGLHGAFANVREHVDPEKITARLNAFATAFESPSFDAKTLKSGELNLHLAGWAASRMARFYEVVTPILTPEQRTKLADHMREHASHDESPAGDEGKEGKP